MDSADKVFVAAFSIIAIVLLGIVLMITIFSSKTSYYKHEEMLACLQKAPITQCKDILK